MRILPEGPRNPSLSRAANGPTGYAQVNGRDELPIPVKAELDGYYAAHVSFVLDMKIFFKTIFNVLAGRGVVEGGTQGK